MQQLFGRLSLILFVLNTSILYPPEAAARKKQPSLDPTKLQQISVEIKNGTRSKSYQVDCYRGKAGRVKTNKKSSRFITYQQLRRSLVARSGAVKKIRLFQRLAKQGGLLCRAVQQDPGNPIKPGSPDPFPAQLSLRPYQGAFSPAEARMLFARFAFGASAERIEQAVADGLENTIIKLTTYVPEPDIEAIVRDLQCDARTAADSTNDPCTSTNPRAFNQRGLIYGVLHRFQHSANPFFERFFFFLHNERMAVSIFAASSIEYHAIQEHINMLRRGATSGDYYQLMLEWVADQLGHLNWLDGASNKGFSPNENFAREFWELGTTGTTHLDGTPVYNDFDVANAALAFSGWQTQRVSLPNPADPGSPYSADFKAFVPFLHAPGPKSIFNGTPWQQTVYDYRDMVPATFAHPRTAEHLAEDLWREYINPFATPEAIMALANLIRQHDYKLLPVMGAIMRSQAVFAAPSRKSLLKHPVDLFFGFLRQSGYAYSYSNLYSYLQALNQLPLSPPSVFGWRPDRLAGEAYVQEWRNTVHAQNNLSVKSLEDNWNYDLHSRLIAPVAGAADPATALVDYLAGLLNIPLNAVQHAALVQYLNHDRIICQSYFDDCDNPGDYFLRRKVFDPHRDARYENGTKVQGLLALLTMLPEYRLK